MASVQRGVTFSLNVTLTTTPKSAIRPQQREKIVEYVKSQLPLYQKHLHTVEEIGFFHINSITKQSDSIKLELAVFDEDGLGHFFEWSKQPPKDKPNGLSYSLSKFFFNQAFQVACEFQSNTKINISVIMSEKDRKKVATALGKKSDQVTQDVGRKEKAFRNNASSVSGVVSSEKGTEGVVADPSNQVKTVEEALEQIEQISSGRMTASADGQVDESEKISGIWQTFIIDVPENKEVTSVRIKCRSIDELNREMFKKRKNIFSVEIQLPGQYDQHAYYSYEVTIKGSVFYIFMNTTKVKTLPFTLENKTVHRDILWESESILSHLLDIVRFISDEYSESELIMQLEDVCKHAYCYDEEMIIKRLLDSGIDHSAKYLVRFAFVVGNLCKIYTRHIYKTIHANHAQEILDALLQKRLSDFPTSCSDYMPGLCKHLFKIGYGNDFCVLTFLNRASPFLSEDMILSALKKLISDKEKVISDNPYCEKLAKDLCWSIYIEYIRAGSFAVKEILEYLFRHLPLEITLASYGQIMQLSNAEREVSGSMQREEDALTAISASMKSQILSFSNRMLKEKNVVQLLKMATVIGKYELSCDASIRRTFEESVMACFASHFLKEIELKPETEDFLHLSGCFVEVETQLEFLQSISESRHSAVRRLFLLLNEDQFLLEAYGCLEVSAYMSWLKNEIRTTQTQNEDELLLTFRTLCEILKLPVVTERTEIQAALEVVTLESVQRYNLKEMLQQIDTIEQLCETEPVISNLYKDQVQKLLKKRGLTPCEVLRHFCTRGNVRVNTWTTCDIVCTIIDLFFKKKTQDEIFQDFLCQIQHVEFWELIAAGEGSRIQNVMDNSTFKQVMDCIQRVTFLLRNNEVDICFITKIDFREEKSKRLLQLGGMKRTDIEALYSSFKRMVEEVSQQVRVVLTVLEELLEKIENPVMPDLIKVIEKVNEIKTMLARGSMSVKDSTSRTWLWGELSELPDICAALQPVMKSRVFWNVAEEVVLTAFTCSLQAGTPLQGLTSVRYLFDCEAHDNDIQEIQNTEQVIRFLIIVKSKGLPKFEEEWTALETNSEMPMQSVLTMFERANVPDEIIIAKTYLRRPIKNTVRNTLTQLWRKNELLDKAEAMTSVLKAFGYNISQESELNSALKSFRELIRQNISEYTLNDVHNVLQLIFTLADKLSDETVSVMAEIGKSSLLVEFLIEIATEDVRNLIDAVEDISESLVQESTVSALIEVKRFLLPLLTTADLDKKGSRWVFNTLQKQTSAMGQNASGIPEKIRDCSLNLHNLKSLYNNVANRGQQTKEVIKCIITKGKFVFTLNPEHECVEFEVSYKENKNTFKKQEAALSDIRSRALLLLNTERQSAESCINQQEFRKFIESVDLCFEIRNMLYGLYSLGHIRYKTFKSTLHLEELQTSKDKLKGELNEWINSMRHARIKYYLMNFIQGCQIRLISDFLEKGTGIDVVEAVLKYIHPHLTAKTLLKTYRKDHFLFNECFVLEELGRSLHEMYTHLSLYYTDMICEDFTTKITECVYKGKLLVAQLDENSDYVIRTVLALYRNTTRRFPEPNQLLLCTRDTTWNEIELHLQRVIGAQSFYGTAPLYCLANVELLQNEVQFRLVEELQDLRNHKDFLLAIVCRGSKNHPFVDQLNDNLVTVQPVSNRAIESLFHVHYPHVFTYTSEVAGLGKTTNICTQSVSAGRSTVTIHISGQVRKGMIIASLNRLKVRHFHTLHLDIGAVDEPGELDILLFELIVMKCISCGNLAFFMPTKHVCVEIANTINNTLRNTLTTVTSFQRKHLLWDDFSDFTCSQEISSPVQVVCQYLKKLDKGVLDREELRFSGKIKVKPLSTEACRILLRKHINITADISFSVVHIFLNVLSDQLKKFSSSAFLKVAHISEMIGQSTIPTVRSNLVRAMIDVSMEFAARSVNACRSTQNSTVAGNEIPAESGNPSDELVAKIIHRVDGMIRWEESNHLIYIFHSQNVHTLSPMYRDRAKVPDHVRKLFESQMKTPLPDFSTMKQISLQNILQRVARRNPTLLTVKRLTDLSRDYALTPDNLLKMLLIMMRIQSKVPVVIMGETGCGKTSLIRYLASICEVPFTVMNIHAGVSISDIVVTVMQENIKCRENAGSQRWLFLDEINTSENIGMMCDMICHHKCNGFLLSPNLVIMGACNPYKLRTLEAIHTAGLTGKVQTDELSKLVYRVLPIPEMMVDYVWDFGSLSEKDELIYIKRMVEGVFVDESREHALLSDLLSVSQDFIRNTEASSCTVSLRDVQRCKTLVPWFISILKKKPLQKPLSDTKELCIEIKAVVLALAHCYHSRFLDKSDRNRYRQKLVEVFKRNGYTCFPDEVSIHSIIKEEQRDILNRMELPPGTAKNTALQENVFVILVCILNRIPIFVVGKPGCSKSLAMQVIRSNLRGRDSRDSFFKTLPQLYCVSFQGSESSTSDGIIKVFEKAENYQTSNSKDSVLSVVLLDEIGLAEISRFNPLKVLHNLLEPEGRCRPDIAVVGISNWALDASKMNRAIHLSRPEMDKEELYETAISIAKSFIDSIEVQEGLSWNEKKTLSADDIKQELWLIADSYITYTAKLQFKNFHGLRDFYSLVKFIARKLTMNSKNLTLQKKSVLINEGLLRNFGGLKLGRQVLIEQFKDCLQGNVQLSMSAVDLIRSNIDDTIARHLMIITKGESVLGILEQNLKASGRERKEEIFGSQFEEDLTDDYNYRILSRIILCMEQGIVLVLKNLENIYGSLYDMLNQNYIRIGQKNNCRIALGPYSNPFCHVADSFRCIVLVDECKVDYTDPPFLNRFEKQFLSFSEVMNDEESKMVSKLEDWLNDITVIEGKHFSKYSALHCYNEELVVSLVLHYSRSCLQSEISILDRCKAEFLWVMRPEVIVRLSHVDNIAIQLSSDVIRNTYYQMPLHDGLGNLIQHQISSVKEDSLEQMTVVFTNSNIHTKLSRELSNWQCQSEKLGAFKSEKQLSFKLQQFWNSADIQILLVHCSAQEDDKHLMLAKSLIERYRTEYLEKKKGHSLKCVYLVVHLGSRDFSIVSDESSNSLTQINYLSGWKLVLLEKLELPKSSLPDLCSKTLLETVERMLLMSECLKEELFWAFTRIQYSSHGRDMESINSIIEKIDNSDAFLRVLGDMIWLYIQDNIAGEADSEWYINVACDTQALNTSANLIDALERHIRRVIKNPLAKIVFKLEHLGALDSYFIEDANSTVRREVWFENIKNECIFSYDIKGQPMKDVSGPECYKCDTPDLCLKYPFSRVIFESIEETKGLFTEEVIRSKVKCELEPDDDLPEEVMNEIVLQQESFILKNMSDFLGLNDMNESLLRDYIFDFCNLYSYTFSSVLDRDTRILYMQWLLKQKVYLKETDNIQMFTQIHCAGWSHLSLFGSGVLLLEMCTDVFSSENILEQFEQAKCEPFLSDVEDCPDLFNQVSKTPDEENECISISEYVNKWTNPELIGKMQQGQDAFIDVIVDDVVENKHTSEPDESGQSVEIDENQSNNDGDTDNDLFQFSGYSCLEKIIDSTQELNNTVDTNDSKIENPDLIQTYKKNIDEDTKDHGENEFIPNQNQKDPSTHQICGLWTEENSNFMQMSDVGEMQIGDDFKVDKVAEASTDVRSDNLKTHEIAETHSDSQKSVLIETDTLTKGRCNMEMKWSGVVMQDLVSFICTKMIPTTKNLIQFTDINRWQVIVRNILVLAAEVSTDSEALHALRLCNDIVSDLVIPHDLDLTLLQNVGNCLTAETIDSDSVFSRLANMFQHSKGTGSSVHIQRTLCQYLIRCLSTNTDTTAYTYLFKAVEESIIPEEEIHLLKPPLKFLIQQELGEDDSRLREMIAAGTEIDEKETKSDDDANGLLCALQSCLSNLFLQGRMECPFVLLIIDLLQEVYETAEDKESNYELMLHCGKIIQDYKVGLQFIAAIAYLKAAISYLTYIISNDGIADTSVLLTQFNAVLSGLVGMAIHKSILDYFLKGLGKNSAISTVMKRCRNFATEYTFVKHIEWTCGYLSKTEEGNPLVLHVPVEILIEGEACIAAQQTTDSFQTAVHNLIALTSEESVHGLLLLYSVMMKDYYLSRYRGLLDDTDKSRATIIWKLFKKQPYTAEQRILMECLLGKRDFMCSHFMLGEESPFQQYMINSVLVSTFALSLCCCKETSGQPLSFLTSCLLKPTQLRYCFLSGFPDSSNTIASEKEYFIENDSVLSLCGCDKRLLFRNHEMKAVCVACGREIPEENLQIQSFVNDLHLAQSLPGYINGPHMIEADIAVRGVSDVSCNILQMLAKGCLLGSIALGITNDADVEEFIADKSSEADVSSQLLTEIDYHWKRTKELLNADDHDVGILFHSILHKGRQVLFEEKNAFATSTDRNLWETNFDSLVLSILDSRCQTIQLTINTCNKLYNLPQNSVEVVIREANEIQSLTEQNRLEQMPSLFRTTARPTKMNFLYQLWPERKTYPFLTASLKYESLLVLPKHIYQILQWHTASVLNTSYTLKRYDCLKLSVRDFHDNLHDLNKRKLSKRKFEDFRHSWNILKKALENADGFETLLPIDNNTKMADCLILDTDCDIYRVLEFLISTQNNFIDMALQLAFSCKHLQYLLRDNDIACFKVVPVTELKKEHLIDPNFDWDDCLSRESHSSLAYGMGKQICYDFHNIEKELAIDLLVRKAYINLEALPKISFTDELYRNFVSLLADVRHSIPQEELPNDIELAFVKASRDVANMSLELINYLDMILTLLKKTKCDSQKSLADFVKERSNILGQRFPLQYLPSPECRVKLCHIICLHELLEELCVDRIIGSLTDTYNTELEADLNEHFIKMPGASLRKSELVSKTLKKFIYRCILMGDMDPEQPLLQFLSEKSFWPLTLCSNGKLKIDGKEEDIKEIIPPSMLVCHVVAAVTQLTEGIETQKQGELRMDRVITSWKSKSESTSKTTRQKKAVKKLWKS